MFCRYGDEKKWFPVYGEPHTHGCVHNNISQKSLFWAFLHTKRLEKWFWANLIYWPIYNTFTPRGAEEQQTFRHFEICASRKDKEDILSAIILWIIRGAMFSCWKLKIWQISRFVSIFLCLCAKIVRRHNSKYDEEISFIGKLEGQFHLWAPMHYCWLVSIPLSVVGDLYFHHESLPLLTKCQHIYCTTHLIGKFRKANNNVRNIKIKVAQIKNAKTKILKRNTDEMLTRSLLSFLVVCSTLLIIILRHCTYVLIAAKKRDI